MYIGIHTSQRPVIVDISNRKEYKKILRFDGLPYIPYNSGSGDVVE